MILTTRTRYGLRAMIELAQAEPGQPLMVPAIAARQGISIKYLHTILGLLREAGLVASVRGRKGGFLLSRPPSSVTLGEIIRAVEGPLQLTDCFSPIPGQSPCGEVPPSGCDRIATCQARALWIKVAEGIDQVLGSVTLAQVLVEGGPQP